MRRKHTRQKATGGTGKGIADNFLAPPWPLPAAEIISECRLGVPVSLSFVIGELIMNGVLPVMPGESFTPEEDLAVVCCLLAIILPLIETPAGGCLPWSSQNV